MFPNPNDETKMMRGQVIADAKSEYAYQMWLKSKADKREDGHYSVPTYLLSEKVLSIQNDEADISDLKVLRSLDHDQWLQNIGGIVCSCKYIKTTHSLVQALCEDDSLGPDIKRYYIIGKKIKFPDGVHKKELPIIYLNNGSDVDSGIEIDDIMAGLIRRSLLDLYAGKVGIEDKTNNTNSEK